MRIHARNNSKSDVLGANVTLVRPLVSTSVDFAHCFPVQIPKPGVEGSSPAGRTIDNLAERNDLRTRP